MIRSMTTMMVKANPKTGIKAKDQRLWAKPNDSKQQCHGVHIVVRNSPRIGLLAALGLPGNLHVGHLDSNSKAENRDEPQDNVSKWQVPKTSMYQNDSK